MTFPVDPCPHDCPHWHDGEGTAECWECPRNAVERTPEPVDSKIAAGSKKSAPFLRALTCMDGDILTAYESPRYDLDGIFFTEWMARRNGDRTVGGRPRLIHVAVAALEMLRRELGDDTEFVDALTELWRVSQFGEQKHGANNWMSAKPDGMWHYEAAMWRHWIERRQGETHAEDSKCYHLAHMAWNALMLLEMELRGVTNPDWDAAESAPAESVPCESAPEPAPEQCGCILCHIAGHNLHKGGSHA